MDRNNEVSALLALQHPDGGWGYGSGSPWTEPTAMALLALASHGVRDTAVDRGVEWLRRTQRRDGGWSPKPGVDHTTWVTSLVLLVPGIPAPVQRAGREWVLAVTGRDSWKIERLRNFLSATVPELPEVTVGWPWFPGTAGWVTPTVMSMLALRRHSGDARCARRSEEGKAFLIARACPDGGWNHGNSRALGVDLPSYPETTGQVLLALEGSSWNGRDDALRSAKVHLLRAASVEAAVWLELGLLAQGQQVSQRPLKVRGSMNLALALMVGSARQGVNAFEL